MHSEPRGHLSYANVVATLALFVALGGSGYAASKSGSDGSQPPVAREAIAAKNNGKKALRGPRARRAQTGSVAATASGAYAHISKSGGLSRAHNVASVSKPDTGVYCVKPSTEINLRKAIPIVTPDYATDSTTFNAPGSTASNTSQTVVEARENQIYNCPDGFPVITGHQRPDGKLERSDQPFFFSVPGRGPQATAVVSPAFGRSPTFDSAYTRGFSSVREVSEGVYCLTPVSGISPGSDPATVDVAYNIITQAYKNTLLALWAPRSPSCKDNEYEVRTFDFASGEGKFSDTVPFSVTVP